ncbi:phosphotransferase family protein [Streptomyces sp. NPDC004111]|uniref:phosphotransferase family protein n=1 Tax=Streptomyces sp. NPDC004111 TaxID=3364690 RepID=UPI003697AC6E
MDGFPTAVLDARGPGAVRTLVPEGGAASVYESFVSKATLHGEMTRGFHHHNFLVPLTGPMARVVGQPTGTPVTVRLRAPDVLPVVVRTWQDESQVLDALKGALLNVPQCLARNAESAVLSYVEGVPLSSVCQNGKPVDSLLIEGLAELLAEMVVVRRDDLPPLPADWPRDGDTRSFLRHLALLIDRDVRQANWTEFGTLFRALDIPDDAMPAFAERVPRMTRRPFSLLHTDLHRDNVIFSYHGAPPLICVDWELASFGDPLHDLATHLVRMKYPADQVAEVRLAWAGAMRRIRPEAAAGMERDLGHYLDFERAQSVYPDVMRAARSLGAEREPVGLKDAARAVRGALLAASGPLRLARVAELPAIAEMLRRWHAARTRRNGLAGQGPSAVRWVSCGAISEQAVDEVLVAEREAAGEQVLKGTGHRNTVVREGGRSVVVRRRLPSATRRERRFNDESIVLAALGQTDGVRAPRVLARGESVPAGPFVVHSYGGLDGRPPEHPVDGLLRHEADDLVDQLAALTRVDVGPLMPRLEPGGFYHWLADQLVDLVGRLPDKSLRLAGELGLPSAAGLREILDRRTVTPRAPVLLHGDLNPWNLVRAGRPGQLALIDWEMAVVGDPLYDLVRHLHLTPHSTAVRKRMLKRWRRVLDPRYTVGWERDVRAYRRIELVRSAYIDLDRLVTGTELDAPNVQRAVDSYAMTLSTVTEMLGLRHPRVANPYLAVALVRRDQEDRPPGGAGGSDLPRMAVRCVPGGQGLSS